MKTRIYDLSKELGVDSKSLVDLLLALGHEVKSHMSGISEEAANEIRVLRGAPPKVTAKPKRKVIKKKPAGEEPKKPSEKADEERAKKKTTTKKTATKKKGVAKKKPAVKKTTTQEPMAVEEFPVVEGTAPPEEIEVSKSDTAPEKPAASELKETQPAKTTVPPTPPKPKKTAPPKPKSRIIGKIELPKAPSRPPERPARPVFPTEQAVPPDPLAAEKPGGKRRGRGASGDTAAGRDDEAGRGRRPRKKKKVFFTRDGQPLYHQKNKRHQPQTKLVIPDDLTITLPITIKDLSSMIGVKAQTIIRKLMLDGHMLRVNDYLAEDLIHLIGLEHGKQIQVIQEQTVEDKLEEDAVVDKPEDLKERASVITFLGHVDHGKTSLLDRIRQTKVVDGEAGGITQHIGAYQVENKGKKVTFLDTPGHQAFTEMRARGANITDLVVLVVAADDGVMPQTEEAISHAKAAGVPIVVAVNKVDRPQADPSRVRQQLSALDLAPEEWGGKTSFVDVSAINGQGVDDLVEMLALEAELLELKANPDRLASGTIIESKLTEGLGVVATVLVRTGTLRKGDIILSGSTYGRVRTLRDDHGHVVDEALPSTPVSVIGLPSAPEVGDRFRVVDSLRVARDAASQRATTTEEHARTARTHVTLETLFSSIEAGKTREVKVILKTDVKGSLEVLHASLTDLSTGEVKVTVIHAAIGGVNEADVRLADASDAIIIGFHVIPEERARVLAQQLRVEIRGYQVIYEIIDDVRDALEGLLEPEKQEVITGHAEVREIFKISHSGTIAGCYMTDGTIERSTRVRLVRDNIIIHTGALDSLRRFKDDVKEVKESFECGIRLAGYDDVKVGDVIEGFTVEMIARKLADSK